jgi:DNA-binding MarR family transcriptional regulator
MPAQTTLTPADSAVFTRIPAEWFDETSVASEIAAVLHVTSGSVLRAIARLITVRLVERRVDRTIAAHTEIRQCVGGAS